MDTPSDWLVAGANVNDIGGDYSLERAKQIDAFARGITKPTKRLRTNWTDNNTESGINDDDNDNDDHDEWDEDDTNYSHNPLPLRLKGDAHATRAHNNHNYEAQLCSLRYQNYEQQSKQSSGLDAVRSDKVADLHLPTSSSTSTTLAFEQQQRSQLLSNAFSLTDSSNATTKTPSNQDWLNVHFTQLMHSLIASQVHSGTSIAPTSSTSPTLTTATPLLAAAAAAAVANQVHRTHPLAALQPTFYNQFGPALDSVQLARQTNDTNCFASDLSSNIGSAATEFQADVAHSRANLITQSNAATTAASTTQTAFSSIVQPVQQALFGQVKSSSDCSLAKHLKIIAQESCNYKSLDATTANPICCSNKLDGLSSSDKI